MITRHTKKGSLYYFDDHIAYATLNLIGKHQVVAHGSEEYVRDNSHINGIEGFGAMPKHGCTIIMVYLAIFSLISKRDRVQI